MEEYCVYLDDPNLNKALLHRTNKVNTCKYSLISFVPLCTLFQFKRLANIYFLLTAIVQSIPNISPISPFTAIAPLLLKRRKNDRLVNHSKTSKWINQDWTEVEWKDIFPGDIIKVHDYEEFPADLLILTSSSQKGDCKIQTANLDGEQNLKTKQALTATIGLFETEKPTTRQGTIKITVNPPDYRLSTFAGKIEINDESYWLDAKQLLLRGSNLRNTSYVIGLVVYAGMNTKIMMNQRHAPFKRSKYETIMNNIVIIQLLIQIGLCVFACISASSFVADHEHEDYLFQGHDTSTGKVIVLSYMSYFILLNSLIPISIIVTLELVKFIEAFFIQIDLKMYSEDQDRCARVYSLNILEELGNVDYVFCDKTGTLTSNIMEFKGCAIGGAIYGDFSDSPKIMTKFEIKEEIKRSESFSVKEEEHLDRSFSVSYTPIGNPTKAIKGNDVLWSFDVSGIVNDLNKSENSQCLEIITESVRLNNTSDYIDEFLTALLVCNDVVSEYKDGDEIQYLGSSPDEVTLVDAAKEIGYVFLERTADSILTNCKGENRMFEILAINEFTAERKRMSVIVRHPKDFSIRLYIKGADTVIEERLDYSVNEIPYLDSTKEALNKFCRKGLRTLCVGFKAINEEDFQEWFGKYKTEKCSFSEAQAQNLAALAEEIEQDIYLLGATAVEDRLQKSVPKAIKEFTEANMKVWMLTGDKVETAENIAYACNLLNQNWATYYILNQKEEDIEKTLANINKDISPSLFPSFKTKTNSIALIIEGDALATCLKNQSFFSLCQTSKSVICCRSNPKQKAEVVKFIKIHQPHAVTLAIGDGGNDVSMIQAAHIGIGIFGKEGHQAADCSDFAICEFRHLRHLMFVHGRWNLRRIGFYVLYFFYKNISFTLVQLYFGTRNGYSGQTVWDDWYLLLFNSATTAAGIVMYSLWDQDVNYRVNPQIKNFWPQLYLETKTQQPLTLIKFILWLLYGIFCSLVVYIIPSWIYYKQAMNDWGATEGHWALSVCMYSSVVVIVNLVLIISMHYWTWFQHFVIWGLGFILYCPTFVFIYDNVPQSWVYASTADYFSTMSFWCGIILCTGICVVPLYVVHCYMKLYYPTLADRLTKNTHKIEPLEENKKNENDAAYYSTGVSTRPLNNGLKE